jgi:hypothetical protein
MATYSWATATDGDWNDAANWTPMGIPNSGTAQAVIDATPATGLYAVTITAGASDTVASLALNPVNDAGGTQGSNYDAGALEVDGTLVFAPGADGMIAGPLQSFLVISGTIVNAGTVDAFIQAEGNALFTGTNGFYVENWLQAQGTVTVDTRSIAEINGNTLFDGIFQAQGSGAAVNLGGPLEDLVVNIATIEGPPLDPSGYTELIFDAPGSSIDEWNGGAYVPIEQTLSVIAANATLSVMQGRGYTTANTLTIGNGGALLLDAGLVTTGGIAVLAGGLLDGDGTLTATLLNDGQVVTSGAGLVLDGDLTGSGAIGFADAGDTLTVGSVGAGQTITTQGTDTITLSDVGAFAGTIVANPGDTFILNGITADHAMLSGTTLDVTHSGQVVATLQLAGTYTNEGFHVETVGGAADVTVTPPVCFVRGTRIRTPRGDVAVEHLREGQLVVTESGATAPIQWIGRRRIDCDRHPTPRLAWPVRIRAGAFGPRQPRRDLLVSPQHALFVQGVLIPAKILINGLNVAQQPMASVDYYHIELPRHDILLAEGMPAESYLENGDRNTFENGGGVMTLHPDMSGWIWDGRACADLMVVGREVEAVRALLLSRAMRTVRLAKRRPRAGEAERARGVETGPAG